MASVTRALVSNKDHDDVMLVADMGAKTTNLGIYDNALRFSDTVDMGGDILISLISSEGEGNGKKDGKDKVGEGLKDEKIKAALEPSMVTLVTEMEKMMKYYADRFNKKTSKIVLCGGASNLPGITEYLTDKLKVEVKIGNPWINIDTYPIKPVPKSEAPAYANAIGLSLRGMGEETT